MSVGALLRVSRYLFAKPSSVTESRLSEEEVVDALALQRYVLQSTSPLWLPKTGVRNLPLVRLLIN